MDRLSDQIWSFLSFSVLYALRYITPTKSVGEPVEPRLCRKVKIKKYYP